MGESMFLQPIFFVSKHPIEWDECLEVVATYLDGYGIHMHHLTMTTACIELETLIYPSETPDWQAIASMLEQDFMTAMTILIGRPSYELSTWNQQRTVLTLLGSSYQGVISFEQFIVEYVSILTKEQVMDILNPVVEQLTHEEVQTIQAICQANLNLSKAAKRLYIHRNTLNYRLEKLLQITGIDVRTFYGAMALYIVTTLKR